jgi:hypothetical protein
VQWFCVLWRGPFILAQTIHFSTCHRPQEITTAQLQALFENPHIGNHLAILKDRSLVDLDIQEAVKDSLDLVHMLRLPLVLGFAGNPTREKSCGKDHGPSAFELLNREDDVLHMTQKAAALVEIDEIVGLIRVSHVVKGLGGKPFDGSFGHLPRILCSDGHIRDLDFLESCTKESLGAQLRFGSIEHESSFADLVLARQSDESIVDFVLVRIVFKALALGVPRRARRCRRP